MTNVLGLTTTRTSALRLTGLSPPFTSSGAASTGDKHPDADHHADGNAEHRQRGRLRVLGQERQHHQGVRRAGPAGRRVHAEEGRHEQKQPAPSGIDGAYRFDGVVPGIYLLSERTPPTGYLLNNDEDHGRGAGQRFHGLRASARADGDADRDANGDRDCDYDTDADNHSNYDRHCNTDPDRDAHCHTKFNTDTDIYTNANTLLVTYPWLSAF